MNCFVLLLLVLCCGNQSGRSGDGVFGRSGSGNGNWWGDNGYGRNNDNDNQCGCSGNGSFIESRNNNIGDDNCRSDVRNFIPYPTSNGGFDERQNNNDCDCNQ